MLPFFRKIRWRLAAENQFFKYSRYAIGEIILVVVGILIALQINNWNEEKKNDKRIVSIFEEIQRDLLLNIKNIEYDLPAVNKRNLFCTNIIHNRVTSLSNFQDSLYLSRLILGHEMPEFFDDGFSKLFSLNEIPEHFNITIRDLKKTFESQKRSEKFMMELSDDVGENNKQFAGEKWYPSVMTLAIDSDQIKLACDYFLENQLTKGKVIYYQKQLRNIHYLKLKDQSIKSYLKLSNITRVDELPEKYKRLQERDLKEYSGVYQNIEMMKKWDGNFIISSDSGFLTNDGVKLYRQSKDTFFYNLADGLIFKRDSLDNILGLDLTLEYNYVFFDRID